MMHGNSAAGAVQGAIGTNSNSISNGRFINKMLFNPDPIPNHYSVE
jgi:hypothetical protein